MLGLLVEDTGSKMVESEERDKSIFHFVDYFQIDHNRPANHLLAKKLRMFANDGPTYFYEPVGEAFTKEGRIVKYRGDYAEYLKVEQLILLKNHVFIEDETSKLWAKKAVYRIDKDYFHAKDNVKSQTKSLKTQDEIFIDADEAFSWPHQQRGRYLGRVKGKIIRKRKFEQGADFQSRELIIDLNKSHIELLDNVYLKQEEMRAYALRGEIFLENYNEKLKYYALYDDVKVVEKIPVIRKENGNNGKTFIERRAYSEKLEGFVKEGKIVLTGYPKVLQEKDVLKGNIITLLKNNEVIEVDDSSSSFIINQ